MNKDKFRQYMSAPLLREAYEKIRVEENPQPAGQASFRSQRALSLSKNVYHFWTFFGGLTPKVAREETPKNPLTDDLLVTETHLATAIVRGLNGI